MQVPLPMATQHRHQGRTECDEAATAVLAFDRFALLEQFGIEAHARVHQKDAVVHQTDLYFARLFGEQYVECRAGLSRDAVGAAEIVEGALWQHAEGASTAERGLRYRVDGAITTGCDHDATDRAGALHRFSSQCLGTIRSVDQQNPDGSTGSLANRLDLPADRIGIGATRSGIEHDEQWRVRSKDGSGHDEPS